MNIGALAKDAHVIEGKRFAANSSADELKAWAEEYRGHDGCASCYADRSDRSFPPL